MAPILRGTEIEARPERFGAELVRRRRAMTPALALLTALAAVGAGILVVFTLAAFVVAKREDDWWQTLRNRRARLAAHLKPLKKDADEKPE